MIDRPRMRQSYIFLLVIGCFMMLGINLFAARPVGAQGLISTTRCVVRVLFWQPCPVSSGQDRPTPSEAQRQSSSPSSGAGAGAAVSSPATPSPTPTPIDAALLQPITFNENLKKPLPDRVSAIATAERTATRAMQASVFSAHRGNATSTATGSVAPVDRTPQGWTVFGLAWYWWGGGVLLLVAILWRIVSLYRHRMAAVMVGPRSAS